LRWLPLSGLVFVGCFSLAVVLYGSGAGSTPTGIGAYYASHASRVRQISGFAVLLVGCVFFIVYVAVLRTEVVRVEPLATLSALSGGGSAVLLAAGNTLWAGSAFTAQLESGYRTSPQAHLLVEDTAFILVVSAAAIAIPLVAITSLAVFRSRCLPPWFGVLGVVAAIGLAGAYWYLPLVLFFAWVACGSLLLSCSRRSRAE
jgi:hypothetical protein